MTAKERLPGGVFMPAILRRLAPRLGAEVIFEPDYEIVGRIRFPNGRQSYFWHNKFNLNSVASARIARDKGHATFFLRELGFQVPRSEVFLQDAYRERIGSGQGTAEARRFAEDLRWQVYLKPLRGSQGDGIVGVRSEREYDEAARSIFARERRVQIQEAREGRDYRLVVLDGVVISAYEREALSVCGDGAHTIAELLAAKQREFVTIGRDTVIQADDPRILTTLSRKGFDLTTVLPSGATERLLDVANLSCGGTTHAVTERLHPSVAVLAAQICTAMDLRFCGVDIVMADATAPLADYAILEVNSSPGLDHYAAHGPDHEAHVDELYLKVLEAIARGPV